MDRRLFPMIQAGLKPGGVLIVESFIDVEMGKEPEYLTIGKTPIDKSEDTDFV